MSSWTAKSDIMDTEDSWCKVKRSYASTTLSSSEDSEASTAVSSAGSASGPPSHADMLCLMELVKANSEMGDLLATEMRKIMEQRDSLRKDLKTANNELKKINEQLENAHDELDEAKDTIAELRQHCQDLESALTYRNHGAPTRVRTVGEKRLVGYAPQQQDDEL